MFLIFAWSDFCYTFMMKTHIMKTAFYLLFFFCSTTLIAQQSSKLGRYLQEQLKNPELSNSAVLQPLLVKGNPDQIREATLRHKGVFKFHAKDICSIAIPYNQLTSFAQESCIVQIDNTFTTGKNLMDTSRVNANVNAVHNGSAPLSQPYSGKGVIVGIIDGSIDINHKDFRKTDNTTRIRYLWDQSAIGSAPQPYAYGVAWDSSHINAGTCTYVSAISDQSHGSCVAGIAAGNGLSGSSPTLQNIYKGIAFDANIIFVRVDNSSPNFLQNVADAADYIFNKAKELGMPCVINTSIGTRYGSHDGTDFTSQAIENLLCAEKGRSFVAAAGNDGHRKFHVSYDLSPTDSLFTWFNYVSNTAYQHVFFDFWADTSNFKLANFAIGCDNTTPTFLKRTKYYNIITDFNPSPGVTVSITDSLFNGATKLGNYTIYVTIEGGTYHVEFLIKPTTTTNLWRLQTLGSGRFDLWASASTSGSGGSAVNAPLAFASRIVTTSTPMPGGFSSANYRHPDSLKTMVSSWQNNDYVITVANYSNRWFYTDVDGVIRNPRIAGETPQDILPQSSLGPTRDNRQKPNISAPGSTTICTADSVINAFSLVSGPGERLKVGIGGKHRRNGGTSMASPVVAGIVALYFETRPTAGYHEINQVIKLAAKTDAFTGAVPNHKWGYGKVDAMNALTLATLGCINPSASNFNPAANIDTGGCTFTYTWNGSVSINWNDPKNWTPNPVCCGPNNCESNVIIPSGTPNNPSVLYGDVQIGHLTMNANTNITVQNAHQLKVCKNIVGSSNATVSLGKLTMNGSVAQNITGGLIADSLILQNALGLTTTGLTQLKSRLVLQSGNLTNNGTLRFLSTSDTRIATIDFSPSNSGAIIGNIEAQRWIPVGGSNQHFVSVPLNAIALSQLGASGTAGFVTPTLDCNEDSLLAGSPYGTVFRNIESNGSGCSLKSWEVVTLGNTDNSRGYSAYLTGNQVLTVNGTPNQNVAYSLSGMKNSGWASHSTAQGRPQSSGWNLVGNPYLSYLELAPKVGLDAQVNIWQTSGPYQGSYQTLMMGSNAVIPPFQGFFVHTSSVGSAVFTVNKTECVNNPAQPQPFYKTENDHQLTIEVLGNGYKDKTEIGFNSLATAYFDPMLDANKFHSKLGQPTLYTSLSALEHLSINTFKNTNETDKIELGLEPGKAGNFELNFSGINTFDKDNVYLLDRKVNTETQLFENARYSFVANETDDWDRFLIRFEKNANRVKDLSNNQFGFYVSPVPSGGDVVFYFGKDIDQNQNFEIGIFDVSGRLLETLTVAHLNKPLIYNATKLSAGVYNASLFANGKKEKTVKFVVK
jgi:subtilisin family serine protease